MFDRLDAKYHFTLDAASSHVNAKCKKHYTIEDNGLVQDWSGDTVWVNPPYGKHTIEWARKAYQESLNGTRIVMLVPARTDTAWFHDYVYKKPNIRIEFLRSRVKYVNSDGPQDRSPFPSMLVYYNC